MGGLEALVVCKFLLISHSLSGSEDVFNTFKISSSKDISDKFSMLC